MYNKVDILLAKSAPVYIEYTEKKTGKSYRTRTSHADTLHHIDLLLLKANTEYTYRVIIDNLFKQKSKELTFKPVSSLLGWLIIGLMSSIRMTQLLWEME